jgi:hypothetical protein
MPAASGDISRVIVGREAQRLTGGFGYIEAEIGPGCVRFAGFETRCGARDIRVGYKISRFFVDLDRFSRISLW